MAVTETEVSSNGDMINVSKCHNLNDISIRQREIAPGSFTKEYYKCSPSKEGDYVFQIMTQKERDHFIDGEFNIIKTKIRKEQQKAKEIADRCTQPKCENNILLDCVNDHYQPHDCSLDRDDSNEPMTCAQFNTQSINTSMCISKKTTCKTENRVTRKKIYKTSDESICARALDGKLYYVPYGMRPKDVQVDLPF